MLHVCVMHAGAVDVDVEAFSALSNFDQFNYHSVNSSTYISDGASDDRAGKCCISNHFHHHGRRQLIDKRCT